VCTTKNKMLIGIKYNNNNNKKKTLIISIRILIRLAFKKKKKYVFIITGPYKNIKKKKVINFMTIVI
jgi:hypothetical protein